MNIGSLFLSVLAGLVLLVISSATGPGLMLIISLIGLIRYGEAMNNNGRDRVHRNRIAVNERIGFTEADAAGMIDEYNDEIRARWWELLRWAIAIALGWVGYVFRDDILPYLTTLFRGIASQLT